MAVPEWQKKATKKWQKEKTTRYLLQFANSTHSDIISIIDSVESKANTIATFSRYYLHRTKHSIILHGSEIAPCDIGKHKDEIHQAEQEIRAQLDTALLAECARCFEIDTPFYIILMEYLYRTDKEVFVP